MGVYKAQCCCGRLSLEAIGEPSLNAICHCDNCKRRTGSAFGWSCYFREEEVTMEGQVSVYAFENDGGRQERGFCPTCGSTLFWRSTALAGMVGVAGGPLAVGEIGEPTASASEAGRCEWLVVPESWSRWP